MYQVVPIPARNPKSQSNGKGASAPVVAPVKRNTAPVTVTRPTRTIKPKGSNESLTLHGQDLAAVSKSIQSVPLKRTLPEATPRTVKCFLCQTTMAIDAVKTTAFGGYSCISRKGCDERRAMKESEDGSAALAVAMRTPAVSAIPAPTSQTVTNNGLRIAAPTAKERAKFERITDEPEEVADAAPAPLELVRVTDEPDDSETLPEKYLNHPFIKTKEDHARADLNRMLGEQGFRWVLNETLMMQGFDTALTHLMGILCDAGNDEGHLPYTGFLSMLETMAKFAKQQGHNALAFYIAQCYFNETGKRVRTF